MIILNVLSFLVIIGQFAVRKRLILLIDTENFIVAVELNKIWWFADLKLPVGNCCRFINLQLTKEVLSQSQIFAIVLIQFFN